MNPIILINLINRNINLAINTFLHYHQKRERERGKEGREEREEGGDGGVRGWRRSNRILSSASPPPDKDAVSKFSTEFSTKPFS